MPEFIITLDSFPIECEDTPEARALAVVNWIKQTAKELEQGGSVDYDFEEV